MIRKTFTCRLLAFSFALLAFGFQLIAQTTEPSTAPASPDSAAASLSTQPDSPSPIVANAETQPETQSTTQPETQPVAQPETQPETQPLSSGEQGTGATTLTTATQAEEMIKLNFPPNLQLKTLIDYISKRLGVNFVYDEAMINKRITISSPIEIPRSSLYSLFEGIMRMNDLALVDTDLPGWKKIIAVQNLAPFAEVGEAEKATTNEVITQVFQLKNIESSSVEGVIRPILTVPGGNMFIPPRSSIVIVVDYANILAKVAQLIEIMDKAEGAVVIKFIEINNAKADDVAKNVTALMQSRQQVAAAGPRGRAVVAGRPNWSIIADVRTNKIILVAASPEDAEEVLSIIEAFDAPANVEFRMYQFQYITPTGMDTIIRELGGSERSLSLYKSVVDDKAKILFVVGPLDIHQKIDSLKKELDVPESAEYREVKFYKLLNTKAEDVLETLKSLDTGETSFAELTATEREPHKTADTAKFSGPNAPPGRAGEQPPTPPVYKKTKAPSVNKSSSTTEGEEGEKKSLSVVAADINTNSIIVIAPPAIQQMYKELIVELDKRRPQVMIEVTMVTLDTTDDFTLGIEVMNKAKLSNEHDYIVFSSYGLSTVDPATGSLAIIPGVGFNGAVVGPSTLNLVIKALATNARAKIVASPRILVNDNAEATLTSVLEQPFTSVNASETVSTTSFGGYAEAGSTLTVTPHINEGDHLQIEYTITLNSFSGSSTGGIPPPRQTNELNSEVTVPDGYAIIAGGLKRKDVTKTVSKIPYLGDIPLLGKAFSLETDSDKESTLFVFIRPVIMRNDEFEDLKYLSEKELKVAEMPSNFPESKPMLMK